MKRFCCLLICLAALAALCACAVPAATAETAAPQATPEAAPEPSPTGQPTPQPRPVPQTVQAFYADPQPYIQGVLIDTQADMQPLLTSRLLDFKSPGLIDAFHYANYTDVNEGGQCVRSRLWSEYSISLKLADPHVDWNDSVHADALADEIGRHLGIDYRKEKVTSYDSDGHKETNTYRYAEGNSDSYSMSWIYTDKDNTYEGTARLTFTYPGQDDDLNALMADCFSLIELPFTEDLTTYEQTYSVGYGTNAMLEGAQPAGSAGISWWSVSAADIQVLREYLAANAEVVEANDFYHCYKIALSSDYLDYVMLDYGSSAGDEAQTGYLVNCTVYFRPQGIPSP